MSSNQKKIETYVDPLKDLENQERSRILDIMINEYASKNDIKINDKVAHKIVNNWKKDTDYKKGDRVSYSKKIYTVLQDHKSQTDWTPTKAISLFERY